MVFCRGKRQGCPFNRGKPASPPAAAPVVERRGNGKRVDAGDMPSTPGPEGGGGSSKGPAEEQQKKVVCCSFSRGKCRGQQIIPIVIGNA
eukprot:4414030-Pyramimonas_sp.AAC.1